MITVRLMKYIHSSYHLMVDYRSNSNNALKEYWVGMIKVGYVFVLKVFINIMKIVLAVFVTFLCNCVADSRRRRKSISIIHSWLCRRFLSIFVVIPKTKMLSTNTRVEGLLRRSRSVYAVATSLKYSDIIWRNRYWLSLVQIMARRHLVGNIDKDTWFYLQGNAFENDVWTLSVVLFDPNLLIRVSYPKQHILCILVVWSPGHSVLCLIPGIKLDSKLKWLLLK